MIARNIAENRILIPIAISLCALSIFVGASAPAFGVEPGPAAVSQNVRSVQTSTRSTPPAKSKWTAGGPSRKSVKGAAKDDPSRPRAPGFVPEGESDAAAESVNSSETDPLPKGGTMLVPQEDKTVVGPSEAELAQRERARKKALEEARVKLTPAQGALIKLIDSKPASVDLRSIGDLMIQLRRKITDNPYDQTLRLRLAGYLYLAGDLEGAAAELKRAVAIAPDDYFAHTILARTLDHSGDEASAESEFQRALQIQPEFAEAHEYYAESLLRRAEVSQAVSEFRRATEIRPSAGSFSGLSEALLATHDINGAVKAARQAVSVEPSSARAHVVLTKALLTAGDYHPALRTARQATLLEPSSAESHISLGRALYANKDKTGAVEEFRQAVFLDPLNAQARNDLGYALYGCGDVSSAVAELRLALRLNPHLGEARNNLEIAIYGLTGNKRP